MSEQPQSIKQSEGTSFYTVSGSGKLYGVRKISLFMSWQKQIKRMSCLSLS